MSVRREFIKLNTSIYTGSNSQTLQQDADGNNKGVIELRLPDSISHASDITSIDLQVNKLSVSLFNLPVAFVPVDQTALSSAIRNKTPIPTKLWIGFWPYYVRDDGKIYPEFDIDTPYKFPYSAVVPISLPLTFETLDVEYAMRTGKLPIKRLDTLCFALENALADAYSLLRATTYPVTTRNAEVEIDFTSDSFSISLKPERFPDSTSQYLFGTPGLCTSWVTGIGASYSSTRLGMYLRDGNKEEYFMPKVNIPNFYANVAYGVNIVVNTELKELLNFLPWISSVRYGSLQSFQKFRTYGGVTISDSETFYIINSTAATVTTDWSSEWKVPNLSTNPELAYKYLNASYRWNNVPTILMSPVSSIVLLMDGMGVTPQIMPINIQQSQGSSLTTTVPVIENYFPLASSVRDIHDVLLVTREAFSNTPLFSVTPNSITERSLRFRVGFVTKDGQLFDLYIPPTGTFSLNLVLCLHKEEDTQAKKRARLD